MIYMTNDGERYAASSPEELVSQLHDASYAPAKSDAEFMRQMAERAKAVTGSDVRHSSAEEFVGDLIAVGWMKAVEGSYVEEGEDKW